MMAIVMADGWWLMAKDLLAVWPMTATAPSLEMFRFIFACDDYSAASMADQAEE
jgi:hypothetical protein